LKRTHGRKTNEPNRGRTAVKPRSNSRVVLEEDLEQQLPPELAGQLRQQAAPRLGQDSVVHARALVEAARGGGASGCAPRLCASMCILALGGIGPSSGLMTRDEAYSTECCIPLPGSGRHDSPRAAAGHRKQGLPPRPPGPHAHTAPWAVSPPRPPGPHTPRPGPAHLMIRSIMPFEVDCQRAHVDSVRARSRSIDTRWAPSSCATGGRWAEGAMFLGKARASALCCCLEDPKPPALRGQGPPTRPRQQAPKPGPGRVTPAKVNEAPNRKPSRPPAAPPPARRRPST
jgi:hypothetical protein